MSKYTSASTYPWKDELEHYRTLAEQAGRPPADGWNSERKLALVESVVRAYTPYQDSQGQLSTRSRVWRDIILHRPMRWLRQFWLMQGVQICSNRQQ